jgi:hypothetical protein
MNKGIDLFEDYKNIPPELQKVLDKNDNNLMGGDYRGLEKALKEVEKIGYTFDYYLNAVPYDLRPIGSMGKTELECQGS